MSAKAIMVQGTGSHVGKSIVVTALCRIFTQDGRKVAPFKSQNMALNSFVTKDGGEMGRSQVAQAEAAGIEPSVHMNPILLKPTGDMGSQVIVRGKPLSNMTAKEYYKNKSDLLDLVKESFERLASQYDIIVIEGAGSPAEINLKEKDIVNMKTAEMADAPVLLVVDIDRGGAFAWVVGTLELLDPPERDRVKGIIINKFRGDIDLLKPGLDYLQRKTGIKVIGVIPYFRDIRIDQEDSVSLDYSEDISNSPLDIAVIRLPRISNFTDFDPFLNESGVSLRYVSSVEDLRSPDLIILPGTKNTIEDLVSLKECGLFDALLERVSSGTMVVGICGGFQMLGREILDPDRMESQKGSTSGLGLLNMATVFKTDKITHQVLARVDSTLPFVKKGDRLRGYEIHMGRTELGPDVSPFLKIIRRSNKDLEVPDGGVSEDGKVWGTYLHGIFEDDNFRKKLLNYLREKKGLKLEREVGDKPYFQHKEEQYDKLAKVVRNSLDMKFVYSLLDR